MPKLPALKEEVPRGASLASFFAMRCEQRPKGDQFLCAAGAAELLVAPLLPRPLAFSCACLRVSFFRDMADVATEGLDLVLTVEVAPALCCLPVGAARLSGERSSRCWPDD